VKTAYSATKNSYGNNIKYGASCKNQLLVLSQLGKKQQLSLKGPLAVTGMPNVEIVVYIRGTVLSKLDE
jgi:hypothetical protein